MKTPLILVSLAAGGLAFSATAWAHGGGGGGGGGGGPGGFGAGGGGMGQFESQSHGQGFGHSDVTTNSSVGNTADNPGRTQRETSRAKRQGAVNASDQAIAHANVNAGLTRPANSLVGLAKGMTVNDSTGATIGTVDRIVTSHDGTVRNVLVSTGGTHRRVVRLAPSTINVAGGVATTTTLKSSIHGL